MTPSADRLAVELNAWFDRLPRSTVIVGHRQLPAFRSMGVIGAQVGLAVGWLSAARVGFPLTAVAAELVVVALTFFGWGLVRRTLTGYESTVLLEHAWLAFSGVALFLWVADLPVLVGLDVFSIGLAVFLAFGRLGCLVAGCCHGTPAPTGIRYGVEHHHEAVPARFIGRRLRPVQLLEAIGLAGIALAGFIVIGAGPGVAATWFLASYALLRFGTESLRGDDRPHLGPVSVPRLMAVVQALATTVGYEAWVVPGPVGTPFWSSLVLLTIALVAGSVLAVARRPSPLVAAKHLDETWSELLALESRTATGSGTEPLCATTQAGMVIVVSPSSGGLHVSLSHPDRDVAPVAVALGAISPIVVRDVAHFAWPTSDQAQGVPGRDFAEIEVAWPEIGDNYFGDFGATPPSPNSGI